MRRVKGFTKIDRKIGDGFNLLAGRLDAVLHHGDKPLEPIGKCADYSFDPRIWGTLCVYSRYTAEAIVFSLFPENDYDLHRQSVDNLLHSLISRLDYRKSYYLGMKAINYALKGNSKCLKLVEAM